MKAIIPFFTDAVYRRATKSDRATIFLPLSDTKFYVIHRNCHAKGSEVFETSDFYDMNGSSWQQERERFADEVTYRVRTAT